MSTDLKVLKPPAPNFVSTRNPCKLCAPLGASLVMRGIEGGVPFLHGSQGCATYMRRYIISHFREPMDIAASGFSEASTIFGGGPNLMQGLSNVTEQYKPSLIGIATTCLTETIGEDVRQILHGYRESREGANAPELVHVSTPSYSGTHLDGFHAAVRSTVEQLAVAPASAIPCSENVNLFPGMLSPADFRHLKEIVADFNLPLTLFPDYSETLDSPVLEHYAKIPAGGTPIARLRAVASSSASIEFGRALRAKTTAASFLQERFGVKAHRIGVPIGVRETDAFFSVLSAISGQDTPEAYTLERGRLLDSYVDGHKYVFGKRALVFGNEDVVIGLASLLSEIGVVPVLCTAGGKSAGFASSIAEVTADCIEPVVARDGLDFMTMGEMARDLKLDFLIGSSKGAALSRELGVPLIRVDFPIHDRIGGQRILHVGYRGAQQLFDLVVNTVLERKQDSSPVGYSYM
ncbi:MAG TPA: nitrogenase component 1 [Candidatus Saccharimonadales bacterium]|nr:nitrogenase component 1 [Candidatus Saccharimonadales bacterium]